MIYNIRIKHVPKKQDLLRLCCFHPILLLEKGSRADREQGEALLPVSRVSIPGGSEVRIESPTFILECRAYSGSRFLNSVGQVHSDGSVSVVIVFR